MDSHVTGNAEYILGASHLEGLKGHLFLGSEWSEILALQTLYTEYFSA
jgi:hypothetical protein